MWRILAVAVFVGGALSAAGCGGGSSKPAGVPLSVQFENAMKETAPDARARKLLIIADKQFKADDATGAARTLDAAMIAAKDNSEPQSRSKILVQTAAGLAQLKRNGDASALLSDAEKSLDKLEDPALKLEVISKAASVKGQFLNRADVAEAELKNGEKLAEGLEDPKAKIVGLLQIAVAYQECKSAANSERTLTAATEQTKSLEDVRKQADCYLELSDALAKLGQADAAQAALNDARQATAKVTDPGSRAAALKALTDKFLRAGKKEDAKKLAAELEQTITKVKDAGLRNQLLEDLGKLQAKL